MIVAALLVLVAALLRQTGVPKVETIWAEDGAVFLDCAYRRSLLDCLTTPYQGYVHVLPRVGASIAALVPPAQASLAITLVAAVTAAGAAALTARAVGLATGSALAGVLGAAGLGLVWQAGREILGNLANAHWILLTAAVVVLVCTWLGSRLDRADIALVAFAGLSSGLAPILAVVALPGAILGRPGARAALTVAIAVGLVQAVAVLATARQAAGATPLGLNDVAVAFEAIVVRQGFFGGLRTPPGLSVPLLIALVALIAAAASRTDWRMVAPGLVAAGTLVGIGMAVFAASILLNRAVNPRYAYVPAALLVAALAIGSAEAARSLAINAGTGLLKRTLGAALVPAVAIFLAFAFFRSFRLEARASNGPDVPDELAAVAASCASGLGSVTIPISPRPASDVWELTVPCLRLGR